MVSEANGKAVTFEGCAFSPEREQLAENLTEYLKLQENGYVLNVDGEWGSGKTFFLKAWEDMLKGKHPTCYIDAWTLDYLNDPLATLSRRILEAMHKNLDSVGLLNPDLEKEVFEGLYKVLSTGVHIAGEIIENTTTPAIGKAIQHGITKLDDKLLKSGKDQYELFKKSEDALVQFRVTLQQYIDQTFDKRPETSPFFIFIDELDRCRPNYAIELLESVKHLFCLKNTVFVVATNRSEMEKSIQKVYGDGFKSDNYLSRFFDRSVSIRSPSKQKFLNNSKKLENILTQITTICYERKEVDFLDFLSSAFSAHNIELREIDKILDQIVLSLPNLENKIFSFYSLCYLFILKTAYHSDFHTLRPKNRESDESLNSKPEASRFSNNFILNVSSRLIFVKETYGLSQFLSIEFKFQAALLLYADSQGKLSMFKHFKHNETSGLKPESKHKEQILEISQQLDRSARNGSLSREIVSLTELFDIVDYSSALQ